MSKELENRVIAATQQYQVQKRKAEKLQNELEEYKKNLKKWKVKRPKTLLITKITI